LRVRSTMVKLRETWTILASPRIGFDTVVECVSSIHTEASAHGRVFINKCDFIIENETILFDVPLPRRMASRPVPCMAATMRDGAVVPSTSTNWSLKLASTFRIPDSLVLQLA
jgi:hypothetical protein